MTRFLHLRACAALLLAALAAGAWPTRAEESPPPDPGPAPEKTEQPPEGGKATAVEVELPKTNTDTKGLGVAVKTGENPPPVPEDLSIVRIRPAAPDVARGEAMAIEVTGPDAFLKGANASYVLSDEYGRQVLRGAVRLGEQPAGAGGAKAFKVPTAQTIATEHTLSVTIVGGDDRRVERITAFRVQRPSQWDDWIALVHAPYGKGDWRTLQRLGIQGGMAYRMHAQRLSDLRMAGVPFYVENVARQFLARYRADPGAWQQVLEAQAAAPTGYEPLQRDPSLAAPEFEQAYAEELHRHAEFYRAHGPLFYSLACEPSVTNLSAAMDFDFHPEALKEFRRWLSRDVYGTVSVLNQAWGTDFKDWDDILPMTTADARLRLKVGTMNFGPWIDFRDFQDLLFAKALASGAKLVRRDDEKARVGITGALGAFAYGGWDWQRLSASVDVVEAYDVGGARALWRDLAPGKPALATLPLGNDPALLQEALRSCWALALEGGPRGVLLWDEAAPAAGAAPDTVPARVLLDAEGKPALPAQVLAPTLRELAGPLGRMLAQSRPVPAEVALVYSPASVRMNWLFESDGLLGDGWFKAWGADTARERRESPQLRLRESWMKLLSDLGVAWKFVSSEQLAKGALTAPGTAFRAVVLPRACALSDEELEQLRAFAKNGGTLVADAWCARFDTHGKAREKPALDDLFGIDTSGEPPLAQPERALEELQAVAPNPGAAPLPVDLYPALPPAYSDKPAWKGEPPLSRSEYRRSPVLVKRSVEKGTALYLNMNLEDYLRWRLRPDRPRAKALRDALAALAFQAILKELPVDLAASELPAGTEVLRLELGQGAERVRLVALRRNLQQRLHELGRGDDSNAKLEKAEPFKLALRGKAWASNVLGDRPPEHTESVSGTLDPVTPTILALRDKNSPVPACSVPPSVAAGETLKIRVLPGVGAAKGPRVYGLRVKAPDGSELFHYGGAWLSADGSLSIEIPFALNDAAGEWTLILRDITTGLDTLLKAELKKPE